jgi:hypothetical protein
MTDSLCSDRAVTQKVEVTKHLLNRRQAPAALVPVWDGTLPCCGAKQRAVAVGHISTVVFSAPRPAARACNLAICIDTWEACWAAHRRRQRRTAWRGCRSGSHRQRRPTQTSRHQRAPAEAGAAQVVAVGKRRDPGPEKYSCSTAALGAGAAHAGSTSATTS